MRKLHEKSILLGIGIGMIITAISGMIFSAGIRREITKEEIISKAKGFGLIEPVKFLNGSSASNESAMTSANKNTANNTSSNITVTKNSSDNQKYTSSTSTTTNLRKIKIEIKNGAGSKEVVEDLLKKRIIVDKEKFNEALISKNALTKIRVGTFMFKENEDIEYIIKTICDITG